MTTAQYFSGLILLSLRSPREGMRQVLSLGLSRQAIWLGLGITVILGTMIGYVHDAVTPTALDAQGNPITLPPPIVSALVTAALLVALDYVVARLGASFGGTGGFFDILLADVWLRTIGLAAMALDIVAYLVGPGLGQLVLFATYLYLFWLTVNFVSEAHGGMHLGKTLLLVILSAFITVIPFLVLLSALGLAPGP